MAHLVNANDFMYRIIDNKIIHSDGNLYDDICYLISTICIEKELYDINNITIHTFFIFSFKKNRVKSRAINNNHFRMLFCRQTIRFSI